MATYTTSRAIFRSLKDRRNTILKFNQNALLRPHIGANNARQVSGFFWQELKPSKSMKNLCAGVGIATGLLFSSVLVKQNPRRYLLCSAASAQTLVRSTANETGQRLLSEGDASRLKLTLYQYQVCPFCCKLRAFLDFYGFPYQIVEVDPIRRKEVKFSEYRKVPILVQEGQDGNKSQMNDSSVIISALTTFMTTEEKDFQRIISFFPQINSQDKKASTEFANKYEIMTGTPGRSESEKEEKQWREWVDHVLVHYIPPNIYRNPSESIQAFSYISSHGKYNAIEKFVIKYAGAMGMFFVAKKLKKKYNLDDDVRSCLYGAARDWTVAIGDRKFMGGEKPNLADLAVYGVLSSIEGLDAFNDMLHQTDIGSWYQRTKKAVKSHAGSR
ncbi:prostaglandin E synthase 2-like [Asterias rubens]|uniref:prostaglandin E synthase 2-like n=1 Tax=Asterias rubens TaxID=7604 RepID=UPI001455BE87|nr:prostaglandin E synthase 2-like [Asterias rubens]